LCRLCGLCRLRRLCGLRRLRRLPGLRGLAGSRAHPRRRLRPGDPAGGYGRLGSDRRRGGGRERRGAERNGACGAECAPEESGRHYVSLAAVTIDSTVAGTAACRPDGRGIVITRSD
jgi:hypothetical protein